MMMPMIWTTRNLRSSPLQEFQSLVAVLLPFPMLARSLRSSLIPCKGRLVFIPRASSTLLAPRVPSCRRAADREHRPSRPPRGCALQAFPEEATGFTRRPSPRRRSRRRCPIPQREVSCRSLGTAPPSRNPRAARVPIRPSPRWMKMQQTPCRDPREPARCRLARRLHPSTLILPNKTQMTTLTCPSSAPSFDSQARRVKTTAPNRQRSQFSAPHKHLHSLLDELPTHRPPANLRSRLVDPFQTKDQHDAPLPRRPTCPAAEASVWSLWSDTLRAATLRSADAFTPLAHRYPRRRLRSDPSGRPRTARAPRVPTIMLHGTLKSSSRATRRSSTH
ncbi:hypothetical protein F5X68DRAFT_203191 [Plectosphaerella plurivora]|uniref:Uncharacterized protein n=1 Tax=Plectosphaerella plurivora TaxID=936078 RepID=A0A9P8VGU8_9PEZI|nr:hypothetical protein F5X68DRAFT_203191 [Plectosphaerella plurivora]